MTRITNFGIKRTYVQAGFSDEHVELENEEEKGRTDLNPPAGTQADDDDGPPRKKKRKRDRKKKPKQGVSPVEKENGEEGGEEEGASTSTSKSKNDKDEKDKKDKKDKRILRKASSERRRLKRIEDKNSGTTCFLCREKGHTAKYCKTSEKNVMEEQAGRSVVGICYRCGSRRHNLSRCRTPIDPLNPLPFSSCFVCHKRGHLASSCPQNKEKGVYPNGGCCKLCGETSHLAKDCGLRNQDTTKSSTVLGTGKDAGADEDDFHILNRKKRNVDRDERRDEKEKKSMDVRAGAHSGVVKAFGAEKRARGKVVQF